jgi:glycopeptide antibiotics resistance protein
MIEINDRLFYTLAFLTWILYRWIRVKAIGGTSFIREFMVNLLFLYMCCLVYITFFPMRIILYAFDTSANLVPFVASLRLIHYGTPSEIILNLGGNLALFVPLGILIPALFQRARHPAKIVGIGFALSLGIELFQLLLAVRVFDIDDILLNSLGSLIGYGIFGLLQIIPAIRAFIQKLSLFERRSQIQGIAAYTLIALTAFLLIYSAQIVQATQSTEGITTGLAAQNQHTIGKLHFGDFMLVLSQTDQGEEFMDTYRRVFFNRYTSFESQHSLRMAEDTYTFEGMSTGSAMNYFIVVKSHQEIAKMISLGVNAPQTYSVMTLGAYTFSYARQPLDRMDDVTTFGFLNQQGERLNISVEK